MGVSSMNNSQTTPLSLLAPNQPSAPSDLSMVNRPPNSQSKSKNVLEPLPKISNATPYQHSPSSQNNQGPYTSMKQNLMNNRPPQKQQAGKQLSTTMVYPIPNLNKALNPSATA